MALSIYNNIYSVIAQNNLTKANSGLSQSIERLSSGLRINHASDDASGLAISEKLRGQIRGLAKASLNAQDAVSFLQTAEGGMEVMGSMLQRMRELAVQAGNGTYTSNDRKELQKEVDQLKSEINRISSATEYNTKKLLTGDAAGLWSTDNIDVEAIIRGAPAEGNYKLTFDVDPGRNAVYKSDVMTVKRDMALISSNDTSVKSIEATGNVLALQDAKIELAATAGTAGGATSLASYNIGTANATLAIGGGWNTSGYFMIEYLNGGTAVSAGDSFGDVRVSFVDGANGNRIDKVYSNVASGSTINFELNGTNDMDITFAATGVIQPGGKELVGVEGGVAAGTTEDLATIALADNIDTATNTAIAGPAVVINQEGKSNITGVTIKDGDFQIATVELSMDPSKAYSAGTNGITLQALAKGDVATNAVRLEDIGLFTNADGRMILDNTQTITIYGNNGSADITMEGRDTIADFAAKMRDAIVALGMGSPDVSSSDLVHYVGEGNEDFGDRAVPGTFVIQSALTGTNSELKFVGDESVLNALSIGQIQDARASDVTVNVSDAHTGAYVGSDKVSDYMLRGVIEGVDVKINSLAGIKAEFNAATQTMAFSADATNNTAFLHIVSRATEVQVGANEGQTFDISIGRMDTTALEIDDAYVMTMEDSQKAITKFDQALEKVNSARATIGAQINRLDYTMQNISTTRQNLIAAESRIRDLDVAEESATFARNQVLVNSAVAMLAQANTLPQTALQLIGR